MGKGKGKKGKNADPQEPPHDPGWERVRSCDIPVPTVEKPLSAREINVKLGRLVF